MKKLGRVIITTVLCLLYASSVMAQECIEGGEDPLESAAMPVADAIEVIEGESAWEGPILEAAWEEPVIPAEEIDDGFVAYSIPPEIDIPDPDEVEIPDSDYDGIPDFLDDTDDCEIAEPAPPEIETAPELNSPDSDGDGIPDIYEDEFGTDPFLPDTDDDGYTDTEELDADTDPLDPNEGIIDSDGDGMPDSVDPFPYDSEDGAGAEEIDPDLLPAP